MNPKHFRPLLAVLLAAIISGCNQSDAPSATPAEAPARPAKIVPVTHSVINLERDYPATLEASQHVDLAFRVGGQLSQLPARAGMPISEGDLLAQLDDTDYRNSVDIQQARFDLARTQHEQVSKLMARNLASQLRFDQTAAELKAARSALATARDNLRYTRLLAPFDGVIAKVSVENHQAIQAKTAIIELQDIQSLDVRFSIPESVISQLRRQDQDSDPGSLCGSVVFNSHPAQTYSACHKEHESVADPLTRNYSVLFSLTEAPDFAVLPGMTATITLDLTALSDNQDSGALFVPIEAVFEEAGQSYVWTVDQSMRTQKTAVDIGRVEQDLLQITSGLHKEQLVIAAGVSYVQPGMRVKPLQQERGL